MNTKKLFICFLVATFIALSTFSATPSSSGISEDSFYKQVEILFQHIERKLSLKIEESSIEAARQNHRLTEQEIKLQSLEDKFNKFKKEQAEWLEDHQNPIIAIAEKKKEEVRAAGDRYASLASSNIGILAIIVSLITVVPTLFNVANAINFSKQSKERLREFDRLKKDAKFEGENYITQANNILIKSKEKYDDIKNIGEHYIEQLEQLVQKSKASYEEIESLKENSRKSERYSIALEKFIHKRGLNKTTRKSAQKLIKEGTGVEVLWGLATLAKSKGDFEKAQFYWEEILQQTPHDGDAIYALADTIAQLSDNTVFSPKYRNELLHRAETYYKELLSKSNIQHKEVILNGYALVKIRQASLAKTLSKIKNLYQEAEEILTEARKINPDDINIMLNFALLLRIRYDIDSSKNRFELLTRAEDILLQVHRKYPTEVRPLFSLAELKLKQAEDSPQKNRNTLLQQAKHTIIKAKQLSPQHPHILDLLARLSRDKSFISNTKKRIILLKQAKFVLYKLKEKSPTNTNVSNNLCLIIDEQAKYSYGDEQKILWEEASNILSDALDVTSYDTGILVKLADIKCKQFKTTPKSINLLQDAEKLINNAIKIEPHNLEALKTLARILHTKSSHENQETKIDFLLKENKVLQKAIGLYPDNLDITIAIADNKFAQFENDPQDNKIYLAQEAESLYRKLISIYPQNIFALKNFSLFLYNYSAYCPLAKKKSLLCESESIVSELINIDKSDTVSILLLSDLLYNQYKIVPQEEGQTELLDRAIKILIDAEDSFGNDTLYLQFLAKLLAEKAKHVEIYKKNKILQQADKYLEMFSIRSQKDKSYDRACLASLAGDSKLALEFLEKALQNQSLPSKEHIEQDKDLDELRHKDSFIEFMKRAYPPSSETK